MKVHYDCHIHSKLSSCADELMTPNNILNMCMLKGLQLVALTDHNSLRQHVATSKIVDSYDFLFLYGVEVTTQENYHLLAYFRTFEDALLVEEFLEMSRSKEISLAGTTRKQVVYDEYDEEVELIEPLLSTRLTCETKIFVQLVRALFGIVVLAHIDRPNTGVLSNDIDLNTIDFDGYELDDKTIKQHLEEIHPILKKKRIMCNSDSHTLTTINEDVVIELEELSFDGLVRWLHDA